MYLPVGYALSSLSLAFRFLLPDWLRRSLNPWLSKPRAADGEGHVSRGSLSCQPFHSHLLKNKVVIQNLGSEPKCLDPNGISKRNKVIVQVRSLLFSFPRCPHTHRPLLGHCGKHNMWILVCKNTSAYIDGPFYQHAD